MGLAALGAEYRHEAGELRLAAPRLRGADILLDEASVTATENVVLAAVRAEGPTVLRNAASEPHVQDLCALLVQMGASIDGIGSNVLTIQGGATLHGADFTLGPDFMEVGSFVVLAAVTEGDVLIEGVRPDDLRMTLGVFARLGISAEMRGRGSCRLGRRAARHPVRSRRRDSEGGRRPLAGVPRRPHERGPGRGHPGRRHGAVPRKDV